MALGPAQIEFTRNRFLLLSVNSDKITVIFFIEKQKQRTITFYAIYSNKIKRK